MASESLTPQPPTSGGSAKYIVILLLLLGGGLGVYLATSGKEEAKPTPPPEVKNVERPTALSNDTVQIPVDEEPDAGEPEKQPETVKRPKPPGEVWACEGDVAPADIMRVVSQNQTAVRSCYERALRNNNQLQGSVKLSVRIGNDGKVSHTRASGSLHEAEVLKCIQNLAKGWSFPSPRGGTCAVFESPFNFTPKN